MKVLIVAFSESIHTVGWINQIRQKDLEIHLFPSSDQGLVHSELSGVTVYHSYYGKHKKWPFHKNVEIKGINVGHAYPASIIRSIAVKRNPKYREKQLERVIKKVKPDLIHSLEIQHGGYLVNEVSKNWKGAFPKWMVTNWGSDIYLFGRLKEHKGKITDVLEHCDYYSAECQRDLALAKQFGFKGKFLPVLPNAGGLDLKLAHSLRSSGKSSARKIIALKGYQTWAGRSLVGLRALERCADLLKGYEVVLYSTDSDVDLAAELFTAKTGIITRILPVGSSHQEMLRLHGRSRISIGLSISDGISTSFLEALAMGSFPIQSETSCANEWIECGKTGFLVPPEDPEVVEEYIRKALTDDQLVDEAAKVNWETAKKRLDRNKLSEDAKKMYRDILEDRPS